VCRDSTTWTERISLSRSGRYAHRELLPIFEFSHSDADDISFRQHAPQYPNLGVGQEYQLLDWLSNVTFPREQMFADVTYATAVYDEVVKRTLAVGVSSLEL
jgi:hypothetical protein